MQFKFDSNQAFQLKPIKAIVNLFEGQPPQEDVPFLQSDWGIFGNALAIDTTQIKSNLEALQKEHNIPDTLRSFGLV